MLPERWKLVKDLFFEALALPEPARLSFIAQKTDDPSILAEVVELLKAEGRTSSVIEEKLQNLEDLLGPIENDPFIGKQIASYHIIRLIGEGGMGAVYLAEQKSEAFHRYVAMKVIRRGMDTKQVIRRFNTERQILAALNHPNIGRLLDGGTSDDGIAYLVMEYIEGMPITEFSDARKLSIAERLFLFQDVCKAVQFAHQNLIVHRDLKPSNILVTPQGEVKLLDFGIAKLLNPNLTPQGAMMTQAVHRVMTPDYASPEQVRGESVTTSSDVYSLGVVLYELLTGHRPYHIDTRVQEEIQRLICEEDPTRPSTVIKQAVEVKQRNGTTRTITPESISEVRSTVTDKLRKQLQFDLDNVVLKAMRKEPQRRYTSAEHLAQDIGRHLSGVPVLAKKGTIAYRTRKFVKRHRFAVSATTAFLLLLVSFAFLYTTQLKRERDRAQQAAAQAEQVTAFMLDVFEGANPSAAQGDTVTAQQLLNQGVKRISNELKDQPLVQARLLDAIGQAYQSLGFFDRAGQLFNQSLAVRRLDLDSMSLDLAESYDLLSSLHYNINDHKTGIDYGNKALTIRKAILEPTDLRLLASMHTLALNLFELNRLEEADSLLQIIVPQRKKQLGNTHPATINSIYALSLVYHGRSQHQEAEILLEDLIEDFDPASLNTSPESIESAWQLARLFQFSNKHARAESLYRRMLEINKQIYDEPHLEIVHTYNFLANTLEWQGKFDEAERIFQKVDRDYRALHGPVSLSVAQNLSEKGNILLRRNKYEAALHAYGEALDIYRALNGPYENEIAHLEISFARVLRIDGKIDEAEKILLAASGVLQAEESLIAQTQTAYAFRQLAYIFIKKKQLNEAKSYAETALQILNKYWPSKYGTAHPETRYILGLIALEMDAPEDAEAWLLESLDQYQILRENPRLSHAADEFIPKISDELSAIYVKMGTPEKRASLRLH